MKVIQLNQSDVTRMVKLILEADQTNNSQQGTPNDELSDTKSELLKQVRQNITQMIANEDVGLMVSLFVFLLTDKSSEFQMRRIGKRLEEHLSGGGKEVDFTKAVTSKLRPLTKNFIKALVTVLEKENVPGGDQDVWEQVLQEAGSDQEYYDLKASSNKNKVKQNAINRITKMSSNPDVIRVFSMFMLYLTDKDTVNDLRALGATYGEKLDALVTGNDISWSQNLIQKLISKFNPMIETMAEGIDKQLKGTQQAAGESNQEQTKNKTQQYKEDQMKVQTIIQKYKIE